MKELFEVKFINGIATPIRSKTGSLTYDQARYEADYWNFDIPLDYEEGRCW